MLQIVYFSAIYNVIQTVIILNSGKAALLKSIHSLLYRLLNAIWWSEDMEEYETQNLWLAMMRIVKMT